MMATGKEPFDMSVALLDKVAKKNAVSEIIQPVVTITTKEVAVGCGALSQGLVMAPFQVCCCVYLPTGGRTIIRRPLLVCYQDRQVYPAWTSQGSG